MLLRPKTETVRILSIRLRARGLSSVFRPRKDPGTGLLVWAKSVEFYTPPKYRKAALHYWSLLGIRGIDLDPATPPSNPMKARRFFTEKDDGLRQRWFKGPDEQSTWVNPPYGRQIRKWVAKIGEEALKSSRHKLVALLPGQRFEQAYWQRSLFNPALTAIVCVRKRISFIGPDGREQKGNPYGSFIYLYNGTYEAVRKAFRTIGMVLEVGRIQQHQPRRQPSLWES